MLFLQTYLITTFCITKEQKNMENLLELVVGQIKYFTEVLQVTVVAWCTGTSGDGSKMRHLLVQRMPWLFVVDCWAHQVWIIANHCYVTHWCSDQFSHGRRFQTCVGDVQRPARQRTRDHQMV